MKTIDAISRARMQTAAEAVGKDVLPKAICPSPPLRAQTMAGEPALQTFDPPGVGASSPTDALILQVERRITGAVKTAVGRRSSCSSKITCGKLPVMTAEPFWAAAKGDETLLQDALALLQTLDPHPASGYRPQAVQYVIADIQVRHRGNRWEAMLNPQAQPAIRLSSMAQGLSVNESSPFGHYLAEARRLISGIEARQSTLLRTASLLLTVSRLSSPKARSPLVPLAISEAAGALGVAGPSIPRCLRKVFQCPLGVFELRSLFMPPSVIRAVGLGIESSGISCKNPCVFVHIMVETLFL